MARFSTLAGAAPREVRASWPSEFERKQHAPSPYGNGPVVRSIGAPKPANLSHAELVRNARRYGQM